MTSLGDLKRRLGVLCMLLEDVEREAGAVQVHSASLRESALQHGWDGVAKGLRLTCEALSRAAEVLGAARETAQGVLMVLDAVPGARKSSRVTAALETVGLRLSACDGFQQAANKSLDEARSSLGRTEIASLISRVDALAESTRAIEQPLSQARHAAAGELQAVRTFGTPSGSSESAIDADSSRAQRARRRSLGFDPAIRRHRADEEATAGRLEDQLSTPLTRYDPALGGQEKGDWVDPASGRVYDACSPPDSRFFDRQWRNFRTSLAKHLDHDYLQVVIDLTGRGLTSEQEAKVREQVSSEAPDRRRRITVLGPGDTAGES